MKFLVSFVSLNQRLTQVSTNVREQASGLMLWSSTNKQLELVESSFSYLDNKKQFLAMVKKHTQKCHDFIVIDLGKERMYPNLQGVPPHLYLLRRQQVWRRP
jgi:NADH dehydrogenase FAD-containing subunit